MYKEIERDLLLKEIDLVKEERLRRSRQQFEYIRLNIINVGILTVFAILKLVDIDTSLTNEIMKYQSIFLSMMIVLMLISIILFLFWLDDAFTIAGFDRFLMNIEKKIDKSGNLYWYEYRDGLNKSLAFKMKKYIFNVAIFLSFVFPPLFSLVIIALLEIIIVPDYVLVAVTLFGFLLLFIPFYVWRRFTKRLYG